MANVNIVGGQSVSLSSLDVRGYVIGATLTDTDGQPWILSKSTAAIDATHLAVLNDSSLRWLHTGTGVASLSGVGVDNTDPTNPAIGGPDKGTTKTAASNVSILSWTGLDNDIDGGYDLEGSWVADPAAGANLILRVNSVNTGYVNPVLYANSGGVARDLNGNLGVGETTGILLTRAGGSAGQTGHFFAKIRGGKTGRLRIHWSVEAEDFDSGSNTPNFINYVQGSLLLAAKITQIDLCAVDAAGAAHTGGIQTGTVATLRKMGVVG